MSSRSPHPPDLAAQLRAATWPLHRAVEAGAFVRDLLGGRVERGRYCLMLRGLHEIYVALEAALARHAGLDLLLAARAPGLARTAALAADLDQLHGQAWRRELASLPAADAYAARLRELADSEPPRLLAHAYVRYLGDLSGGQALARVLKAAYALPGADGTRFYDFGDAATTTALAQGIRTALAQVDAAHPACAAIVDEAQRAFERHRVLFDELQAAAARQGPADASRMRA